MAKKRIEFNGLKLKVDEDDRVLFAQFESSNLAAAAYDIKQKQLIILFKGNTEKRYCYNDVPAKVFHKMIAADSVGSFFSKEVKAAFKFYDETNK